MTQVVGREAILEGLERTADGLADAYVWRHESFRAAVLKFFFTEPGEPVSGEEVEKLRERYGEAAYYDGRFGPEDAQDYLNIMRQARGEE